VRRGCNGLSLAGFPDSDEKLGDGLASERFADGGPEHDVLEEEWSGESRDRRLPVDSGRQRASLHGRGQNVMNGLKDAVDEAALGSD